MPRTAYVYILASRRRGAVYTGVTSDLARRLYQHRHHLLEGFTSKYEVTRLVWYLQGEDMAAAIALEKKIKNRGRQWKIDLIEKKNPRWHDLAAGWMDSGSRDCAQDDRARPQDAAAPAVARAIAKSTDGTLEGTDSHTSIDQQPDRTRRSS